MIFLFLIAAVVLLDLGLKDTIDEMDQEQFPKELEGSRGWILLYRNHNEGFPFGALKEKKELVKMIPLAVVSAAAGILCWILPKKGQFVEKIGLSMVSGGGLSNLYDRLFRGYVVDYFSIQWKKLKDVVFNLGDIFVFAGSLILLLRELFCKK